MTDHTTHFDGCGCPLRNGFAVAVWVAEDFVENYGARTADGRFRITMALGEPDARGVYNPIITKHDNPLPVFAERDALRLRVAALEAAARKYAEFHGPSDCHECDGDDCEAHATSECRCGGPAIDRELNAAIRACLEAGDTTALRAMLVEAVREADKWRNDKPEAIADRILGASKERGE